MTRIRGVSAFSMIVRSKLSIPSYAGEKACILSYVTFRDLRIYPIIAKIFAIAFVKRIRIGQDNQWASFIGAMEAPNRYQFDEGFRFIICVCMCVNVCVPNSVLHFEHTGD